MNNGPSIMRLSQRICGRLDLEIMDIGDVHGGVGAEQLYINSISLIFPFLLMLNFKTHF